jgi:hypothetical protein
MSHKSQIPVYKLSEFDISGCSFYIYALKEVKGSHSKADVYLKSADLVLADYLAYYVKTSCNRLLESRQERARLGWINKKASPQDSI